MNKTDIKIWYYWNIKRRVLGFFGIYPPFSTTMKQVLRQLKKENCYTGDGWTKLLIKLTQDIIKVEKKIPFKERLFRKYRPVKMAQIKEKFGGLRFYTNGIDIRIADEVNKLINKAEDNSYYTCEFCGMDGAVRKTGWIKTMCDRHYRIWQNNKNKENKNLYEGF